MAGFIFLNDPTYGVAAAAANNSPGIQQAINDAVAAGIPLVGFAGIFKCTSRIEIPQGLTLIGPGALHPVGLTPWNYDPAGAMILLFTGTGTRDQVVIGVTDLKSCGGVYPNASNDQSPYNDNYALTSFYNSNANLTTGAAATQRQFSAAVKLGPGVRGVRLSGLSIIVGYSGSLAGYTAGTSGFGTDSWDVGLYYNNAQDCVCEDVTVLGYWRIAGHFGRTSKQYLEFTPSGGYERNKFIRCWFQGLTSVLVRGGDTWPIIGVGTTAGVKWLEIPWADNHPFNPAISSWIGVSATPHFAGRTYTGVQKIGDRLRLTGVNDIAGITTSGWSVALAFQGLGTSDTEFKDCQITGLRHASGHRSTHSSIALPPSKGVEISGLSIRGLRFPGCKIQLLDEVGVMIHAATDTAFGPLAQFEAGESVDGTSGIRFLASPAGTSRTAYPNGSTFRLWVDSIQNTGVDFTPEYGTQPTRFTDSGYFQPNTDRVSYYSDPLGYQGSRNFFGGGQNWGIASNGVFRNPDDLGITSATVIGPSGTPVTIVDYKSLGVDVPDDHLLEIILSRQVFGGLIYVGTNLASGPRALMFIRATTSAPVCQSMLDVNGPVLTNVDLSVTPGVDGKLTISSIAAKIQINNRLGGLIPIRFALLAGG